MTVPANETSIPSIAVSMENENSCTSYGKLRFESCLWKKYNKGKTDKSLQ